MASFDFLMKIYSFDQVKIKKKVNGTNYKFNLN